MEDKKFTIWSLTGISRYIFGTPTEPHSKIPDVVIPKTQKDPRDVRIDNRWDWLPENPQRHAIFPAKSMENTRAANYNYGKY